MRARLQEKAPRSSTFSTRRRPNKKQKQAKVSMLDSAPRVVRFEFSEGCFASKKLKEMGFRTPPAECSTPYAIFALGRAARPTPRDEAEPALPLSRAHAQVNEDNPNISPFAIKNVTFGTSRRELHGADTNWLDVGRNELRIDLQDPMGGDAHVLIEYQNIADGSVRLINHSGAILRFDVPVKHVKLNDLSAEASQVVLLERARGQRAAVGHLDLAQGRRQGASPPRHARALYVRPVIGAARRAPRAGLRSDGRRSCERSCRCRR